MLHSHGCRGWHAIHDAACGGQLGSKTTAAIEHTSPLSNVISPAVSKVTLALAAAELLGDKMRSAPDRIITPGILARVATGAIAGAAVAPSRDRTLGAVLGATVAVGAAYLTLALRKRAIRDRGQTSSGLIEDAVALGAALWVAHAGRHGERP